jgi:hypothetical protein
VHKASFYDPEVNRSYGAMAAHYGVGILPARPYRPKDKAKVEAGVRIAQFYLLGRLRNLKFFSLAECNMAITETLVQLNGRVMHRLGVRRRELFDVMVDADPGKCPFGVLMVSVGQRSHRRVLDSLDCPFRDS